MLKSLHWVGRALGALCGAALALAWCFALWVPTAGLTLSGVSFVVALALAVFALFAMIASWYGHYTVLVLLFLASFFPIGAFLMPTEHWLKWTGWGDLGLLLAAVLMWFARRSAPVEAAAGGEP